MVATVAHLCDHVFPRLPVRQWAVLIARIYGVFPLLCPMCGGQMRLIAFITEGVQIRRILDHIGVDSEPAHISPARGPPLWDDGSDAQTDEGVHIEPDWATDWDGRRNRHRTLRSISAFCAVDRPGTA